jgi:hypothetical protein
MRLNSLCMCMDRVVQKRFYEDFPLKPEEMEKYKFEVGSSLKATQIHTPIGSTNAIPSHVGITRSVSILPIMGRRDS